MKIVVIGLSNGLSLVRCQAFTSPNDDSSSKELHELIAKFFSIECNSFVLECQIFFPSLKEFKGMPIITNNLFKNAYIVVVLPVFVRANNLEIHCNDVIISVMASQITRLTIVYSNVYSGADQRKYQSSASLAFMRGIHRSSVNSPHKWPVTRKMFPFDDVIMHNPTHTIRDAGLPTSLLMAIAIRVHMVLSGSRMPICHQCIDQQQPTSIGISLAYIDRIQWPVHLCMFIFHRYCLDYFLIGLPHVRYSETHSYNEYVYLESTR